MLKVWQFYGQVKKNEATEKYWIWFITCVTTPYTRYCGPYKKKNDIVVYQTYDFWAIL